MPRDKDELLQSCYTLINDCLVLGYSIRELHADPKALLRQIEEAMPDIDKGDEDEWEDWNEVDRDFDGEEPEEDEDELMMEAHLAAKVLG